MKDRNGKPKRKLSKEFLDQRFPPGKSGHIEGRPRGSRNRAALIRKVFSQEISAEIGGKKRKVSLTEAVLNTLVSKALKDRDIAAIKQMMQLWLEAEEAAERAIEFVYPFSDADRKVIATIHDRLKAVQKGENS